MEFSKTSFKQTDKSYEFRTKLKQVPTFWTLRNLSTSKYELNNVLNNFIGYRSGHLIQLSCYRLSN